MTQLKSVLFSFVLFVACGRADQGADASFPETNDEKFAEADGLAIPTSERGVSVDNPGSPVPLPSPAPAEANDPLASQDGAADAETINPPTQVTGTYMNAIVLAESATSIDIGLSAYYKGERVSLYPETLQAIWSLSASADPQVTALLENSSDLGQDMILRMSGESLKAVRAQFSVISVMLQVKDLKLNKNSSVLNQSVLAALQESSSRAPASTSASTSEP